MLKYIATRKISKKYWKGKKSTYKLLIENHTYPFKMMRATKTKNTLAGKWIEQLIPKHCLSIVGTESKNLRHF